MAEHDTDLDAEIARLTQLRDLRAEQAAQPSVDELRDQADSAAGEDFDQFWSGQRSGGKVLSNVLGRDLQLPRSLPLVFEVEARRLQSSQDPDDVKYLFGLLFGADTYDDLVARGLNREQFMVLLVWGSANGNGQELTLPQARARFIELQAASAEGKASAEPGSGATSAGPGRSSKPTSRGSTGRKKKRSRR